MTGDFTMNKRIVLAVCSLLLSSSVFAQASGGQITRPNSQREGNVSHSRNEKRPQHEMVDLGLSVKWAKCNIGATKPEEYGNYFAWGETKTKKDYSWRTYFDVSDSDKHKTETKSVLQRDDFKEYNRYTKTKFGRNDDAASVLWGNAWRTPTHEEFTELWTLSHQWTTVNGVSGMKFTAANGNSIFLPAAGGKQDANSMEIGETAIYWICELHDDDYDVSELAKMWYIDNEDGGWSVAKRCFGFPIRPVIK